MLAEFPVSDLPSYRLRALVWPHLPALLVDLVLVVLRYGLLARRRWVPRLHRPVFGR
jgi:hypothetical protein